MSTDQPTIDHYEASVPYYTLAFDRSHSRFLDRFLDRLGSGARVLELGCGTGRDAARMIERGFAVDATDGTAAMVAKANERHGVNARQMRFEELAASAEYDAIWAHACLMHVPTDALSDIVGAIHTALVPGGLHFASYKRGDDEFRDDRGRFNSRVTQGYVEELYSAAGFEILELAPWQGKGADGVMRDWLAITARRPD
ncbi:hypothetical protein NAP1_07060 [Erythrobacter sp. NAP1]|uniref:class I SAM-dependent methyltransferase n=1 Tax=Erythrobacter sp. NAP1 TaxID=237727 RepID=UPI0000686C57|nr:class I SAM-dependent methyltransferase [Erythrobacter sp. NAP1]EAQ30518.1 hypothetical protein NAP1_07060 [Erythrobacter sp. NAP1]